MKEEFDMTENSKPKVHRDWSVSIDGRVIGWVGHTRGSYRGNVFWCYDRRGLYGRKISGNGVFHTRAEAVAALVSNTKGQANGSQHD